MVLNSYQSLSAQSLITNLDFRKSMLCFEKIYLDEENLNREIRKLFNIKNLDKKYLIRYRQIEEVIDYLIDKNILFFCNPLKEFMDAEMDPKTRNKVQEIKKSSELNAFLDEINKITDPFEFLYDMAGVADVEAFLAFNSRSHDLQTYWCAKIQSQLFNRKICTVGADGNIVAKREDIYWTGLSQVYKMIKQPSLDMDYEHLLALRNLDLFNFILEYNPQLDQYRTTPPTDVLLERINERIS
ncbi:hypothetical protein A4D02_35520 [Niastella koreensis]|uniref:Uncharacterized protein n=2 Tax=Niastella koreensis TaxID=354356 RepID=G8TJF1_NIAKG|nr:hypothetical protein [Niastella koreensis]AEV99686.1 hypothetical protein Niako_3378 [Niastella koreensis GR20-10]OQP44287.1 hypothetical protein A4D02_35520 [Niastella koreensis]